MLLTAKRMRYSWQTDNKTNNTNPFISRMCTEGQVISSSVGNKHHQNLSPNLYTHLPVLTLQGWSPPPSTQERHSQQHKKDLLMMPPTLHAKLPHLFHLSHKQTEPHQGCVHMCVHGVIWVSWSNLSQVVVGGDRHHYHLSITNKARDRGPGRFHDSWTHAATLNPLTINTMGL